MSKLRKGFTLLELLVVIAVMGVLGSMAMISGQEAMDVANASNVVSGFESVSAAMMMYYSEVSSSADVGASDVTAETVAKGVKAYIKNESSVTHEDAAVGVYKITVDTTTPFSWWLTYTLPGDNTRIGKILETQAARLGLKKTAAADGAIYDGTATFCMKVR